MTKASPFTLLLAACLLLSVASAHELFLSHPNVEKQTVFTWIGDHIKLVFWLISTIIVLPIGTIMSLLGSPNVYGKMYESVVTKIFKLSSKKVVKEGDFDWLFI